MKSIRYAGTLMLLLGVFVLSQTPTTYADPPTCAAHCSPSHSCNWDCIAADGGWSTCGIEGFSCSGCTAYWVETGRQEIGRQNFSYMSGGVPECEVRAYTHIYEADGCGGTRTRCEEVQLGAAPGTSNCCPFWGCYGTWCTP